MIDLEFFVSPESPVSDTTFSSEQAENKTWEDDITYNNVVGNFTINFKSEQKIYRRLLIS
jgi:hypothetical protein